MPDTLMLLEGTKMLGGTAVSVLDPDLSTHQGIFYVPADYTNNIRVKSTTLLRLDKSKPICYNKPVLSEEEIVLSIRGPSWQR
jgi:hypothetical protein